MTTRKKRSCKLFVTLNDPTKNPVTVAARGRVLWALQRLVAAGANGCTPTTEPAPRWAANVHTLRGLGVPIETIQEEHTGDFPGTHAKYVVRANVTAEVEGGNPDGETL